MATAAESAVTVRPVALRISANEDEVVRDLVEL